MDIELIAVPYDSALRGVRMGRGPEHLLANGLPGALMARGHPTSVTFADAGGGFPAEIATAFELQRLVASHVKAAVEEGKFPLVLAGNCNVAVGVLAGLGREVGIVWLDAHGDFNTPETTTSGFLDGMALATATGRCWGTLAARLPGFDPVPESCVVLVGARDLEPLERALLEHSHVALVPSELVRLNGARAAIVPALERLRGLVPRIYLHVDLDVLDPAEARANGFTPAAGISVAQLIDAVRLVAEARPVVAAAITALDPDHDCDGSALRAGIRVAETILAVRSEQQSHLGRGD